MIITPIEQYKINETTIYVKREDLVNPFPAANNAKSRGVQAHMETLQKEGKYTKIGILDSGLSRAGWIVSALNNMVFNHYFEVYVFMPQKAENMFYRKMITAHNGHIELQKGAKQSIRYNRAKKYMTSLNGYLLPDKLHLPETISEVAEQVCTVPKELLTGSVIISCGGGTITTGLVNGLLKSNVHPKIYAVMSTSEVSTISRFNYIKNHVKSLFGVKLNVITSPYKYKETPDCTPPFPCDLIYDRKAWQWLT
ncbi:MAG: pyridoxal-phosphate dependent enzyme, partial [Candidatus Bathyarchaeia archaeon]